jgi:hypothetical protein
LTSTLAKFTQGRDNLDVQLGGQNKSQNKNGLGFNGVGKQKLNEHFNQSNMYSCFFICDFCNRKCYSSHKCRLKKNGIPKNVVGTERYNSINEEGKCSKKKGTQVMDR